MAKFEYKVVPAPQRGKKGKGVKGTPGRFANQLETVMNELGAEGWEYLRSDTLPCQERVGLTGKTTTFQNMLVFRRALDEANLSDDQVARLMIEQNVPAEPAPKLAAPKPEPESDLASDPAPKSAPKVEPEPPQAPASQVSAKDAAAKAAAVLSSQRAGRTSAHEGNTNGSNFAAE